MLSISTRKLWLLSMNDDGVRRNKYRNSKVISPSAYCAKWNINFENKITSITWTRSFHSDVYKTLKQKLRRNNTRTCETLKLWPHSFDPPSQPLRKRAFLNIYGILCVIFFLSNYHGTILQHLFKVSAFFVSATVLIKFKRSENEAKNKIKFLQSV